MWDMVILAHKLLRNWSVSASHSLMICPESDVCFLVLEAVVKIFIFCYEWEDYLG